MIILLNAVTKQAASDILSIISLLRLASNVSFLHRQPCSHSREKELKQISVMLI